MSEILDRSDIYIDGTIVQVFNSINNPLETEPLVLLTGIGATNETWGKLPELINRTTIAIDVSKSMKKQIPTMRDYAKLAVNVLNELEVGRVNALGLSWGSLLTQELAMDYPDRFDRLILAGGAPGLTVPPKAKAAMLLALPNRSPSYMKKHSGSFYGGDVVSNLDLAVDIVRDIDHAHYRRQQLAALSCGRNFYRQLFRLSPIKNPTLIMYGDDDPISRYPNSHAMYLLIQNSQLHKVKKGGHLFLITRPEESAITINNFLDMED